MLWYYKFNWHEHTTREQMARRVIQQHEAGANHPELIKGWYNLAGEVRAFSWWRQTTRMN